VRVHVTGFTGSRKGLKTVKGYRKMIF